MLTLLAEQKAISVEHLAALLGERPARVDELVVGLEGRGLARSAELLTGEPRWVWLTRAGIQSIGESFVAWKPRLGSLRHMHAINEVRVRVEGRGVPGLVWVSERALRSGRWMAPSNPMPDAVVEVDGERHAIEAELSRKREVELHEKLDYLTARFDRIVYFATPAVRRLMVRLGLLERYPKLVLQELEPRRRQLDRREWRVPGDPEPPPATSTAARAVQLDAEDRAVMRLLAEQYAIPMDQLGEFLGESESALEERVLRYMQGALVLRGRPMPTEAAWVWLRRRGMIEAGYELSVAVPRIGGLERLRAVNDIRLAVCGQGSEVGWVSGRLLQREKSGKGAPPVGVVELGAERHSVDVWTSIPEPSRLWQRLARRGAEYDAVVWFYSRRACARIESFGERCEDPKLVVRPIPKVDVSGLCPAQRHARGRRRPRAARRQTREEMLWERLREAPPRRLVPVTLESVVPEAIEEVAQAACRESLTVSAAWQRPGSGMRLYRLETDAGVYRVIHSSWGWRADVVRDESVFELAPGEPRVLGPLAPVASHGKTYIEPRGFEVDDEVWERVRSLIPPVEDRWGSRGRRPVTDRAALSGIVWRLRHGAGGEWPEVSMGYGSAQQIWRRCREWKTLRVWGPVRDALERELPDGAELDFSRFTGAPPRAKRRDLNGRQRQLLCRLQNEAGLVLSAREYATAAGIGRGLASQELRELVRRELLVGRRRRGRGFRFWAPRDLCARLVAQGREALVCGDDADWRPQPRRWAGDRDLEVLRVICEERGVEMGLLARICGVAVAELGEALVRLREQGLVDSEPGAVGEWPWVWPRRRSWELVEALRRPRPTVSELPRLWAVSAARALLAERHGEGEWLAAVELAQDMRAEEARFAPAAVLEVMGQDGLLRRRAVEVSASRESESASSTSYLEEAVASHAKHYDGVDLVCGSAEATTIELALGGVGVEVWGLPAVPSAPRGSDREWLARLEEPRPGDRRRGWTYPLRDYEGRRRLHLVGPVVVYGIEPSSLPDAAREAVAAVVGSEGDARPLEVWKRDSGGTRVFCVRTASAEFRVAGAGRRWRGDEVVGEGVFDKRPRRVAPKRKRLFDRGPKAVYEVDLEEFPAAGAEAIRVTAEAAVAPSVRAVWQSFGGGAQIYCVECVEGTFRVVKSRWGWRADYAGRSAFVKRGRCERPLGELRRMVVYELEAEAVPPGLMAALAEGYGVAEDQVIEVWRRSKKEFVYCAVTDGGMFRVRCDRRWGWQAEKVGEQEFVRESRPMPSVPVGQHIVEPPRFEVDDEIWARIAPLMPEIGGGRLHRGNVRYSDRAIVSGVLYFLRNELSGWAGLPEELGFGTQWACPRRVGRWERLGAWEAIRAALERELPDGAELDFSRVRGRRR